MEVSFHHLADSRSRHIMKRNFLPRSIKFCIYFFVLLFSAVLLRWCQHDEQSAAEERHVPLVKRNADQVSDQ